MEEEIADDGCANETGEGEEVGDIVDVFVGVERGEKPAWEADGSVPEDLFSIVVEGPLGGGEGSLVVLFLFGVIRESIENEVKFPR